MGERYTTIPLILIPPSYQEGSLFSLTCPRVLEYCPAGGGFELGAYQTLHETLPVGIPFLVGDPIPIYRGSEAMQLVHSLGLLYDSQGIPISCSHIISTLYDSQGIPISCSHIISTPLVSYTVIYLQHIST